MKKIFNYVLVGVFTITALLVAVTGLGIYSDYMEEKEMQAEAERQYQETVIARNAEAQNRVIEMESEIFSMTGDVESLQAFIDSAVATANEVQYRKESGDMAAAEAESVSDNMTSSDDETVSGNMTVTGSET